LCLPAKFYCVIRTMMITGKTSKTLAIMLPCGNVVVFEIYVLDRANLRAETAFDTFILCNLERFICYKMIQEITADNPTVYPWLVSNRQIAVSLFAVQDTISKCFNALTGSFLFLPLLVGLVNIHEWKTDIRLWHD